MEYQLPREIEKRIADIASLYGENFAERYRKTYLTDPTKSDRELLKIVGAQMLRDEHEADITILRQRCTT